MSVGSLSSVPSEITRAGIFSYFNAYDLARCSQVCRLWRTFARDDLFWQPTMRVISDKLQPDVLKISRLPKKNLKRFIDCRAVDSPEKLVAYFKKFAQETGFNQRNRFICVSPFNSVFCVVDLGLGQIDLSGMSIQNFQADVAPHQVHLCFYMKDLSALKRCLTLRTKMLNKMGPTPSGEGFMIYNAFLVVPAGADRKICDIMVSRVEELQSQHAEAGALRYGAIGIVIGLVIGVGLSRTCTLF
jgi:hypothetical protein